MTTNNIILTALTLALLGSPAFAATDYSAMSTEELAARRGTMFNAAPEEHQAFRNEWQKRMRTMSPEERQKYGRGPGMQQGGRGEGNGQGYGPGTGQGPSGDNQGRGMGYGRGGAR